MDYVRKEGGEMDLRDSVGSIYHNTSYSCVYVDAEGPTSIDSLHYSSYVFMVCLRGPLWMYLNFSAREKPIIASVVI